MQGDWTEATGHRVASELFRLTDQPTAIVAANDLSAVGVLTAADSTSWSTPLSRRCRLRTIAGVNDPSRSRGTAISTGPTSVNIVFDRVPLRELPPFATSRLVTVVAQMPGQFFLKRSRERRLGQPGQ